MFCWPRSRGSSTSRKKSKSSDLSSVVDNEKISGGNSTGGILVKPYKPRKKGKTATFKCDLSEALLPPSEECLINRSASCNSSIRELSYPKGGNVAQKGTRNKNFVSSQTSGFGDDPVNNNNRKNGGSVSSSDSRSAKVLLYYSNNSLSTRNSLADFIENEDFNYKSLWGKDISEWDSRESRCHTLERKTGGSNDTSKTTKVSIRETKSGQRNNKEQRLTGAASSPALSTTCSLKKTVTKALPDDDNEPLPSPPPTPPEVKALKSSGLTLKTSNYFKYPDTIPTNDTSASSVPFRIHSSTSTSSLSSSYILAHDAIGRLTPSEITSPVQDSNKSVNDCASQTLPFWQLEFPGILYCTTCRNRYSHDSGTVFSGCGSGEGGVVLQQQTHEDGSTPLLILATQGHESPGGDSSSGISSSDDNLESLQTPDEEAMLKSLKNSFLHQAIPFQLCNFSINSGGGGSTGSATSVVNCVNPNSTWSTQNASQQCQSIITNELSGSFGKNQEHDENQHRQLVCHLPSDEQSCPDSNTNTDQTFAEDISSVTNHQDRNRLGPVGKNYGPAALDANANESEAPLLRGQQNGESDGKPSTKVPETAEPHLADHSASSHIITGSKTKSGYHSNRVTNHNQHNHQNSVLVQENSSLKEEVSRLTSVVSDLQEQISRLAVTGEVTKQTLEECLAEADTRSIALSIVTQQFDKKRLGAEEQLVQQHAENIELKQHLDEKLAELHSLQYEYEKERERNHEEVQRMLILHRGEVDVTVESCKSELEQMQKRHDETLADIKRSHTEELEKIKRELEQTKKKQREELEQYRNQSPHDILHKEVESLNVVVKMKIEEVRGLEKDLIDYKNTLNDLQKAREHAKSLVAKIEGLEAQLEKARADKRKLQEEYKLLETQMEEVESDNKRLVRGNDELLWKITSIEQASAKP